MTQDSTTTEILLEASALGPGERMRTICPACRGGQSSEHSLSIRVADDGAILWNCFRASCDTIGAKWGTRVVRTRHTPREQTIRPYTGELRYCTDEELAFLEETIGWTEEHLPIARPLYAPKERRYAFPVFGPTGARRGYVLRSWQGNTKYKALTRMDVAEPHMSWYKRDSESPVVVVEDIPSAVRAARYVNAVSLCGTGCGHDYLNELSAHTRRVMWALDADATSLAIQLHRKGSLLFDESRVLVLTKDIKDMDEADVAVLLGGYTP